MQSPQEDTQGRAGQRKNKRARNKGVFACDACRARRSKCDLVDRNGCHRCKQLRTDCSLRTEAPDSVAAPTSAGVAFTEHAVMDHTGNASLIERMAQMERELKRMQDGSWNRSSPMAMAPFDYSLDPGQTYRSPHAFTADQSRMAAWSPSTTLTNTNIQVNRQIMANATQGHREGKADEDRDEAWFRRTADPETFGRIDRGILGKEELGLRDPIAEGIISKRRAEEVYVLFKHHFSCICPHPSFASTQRSLPQHPFLLSASLYYATRCLGNLAMFTSNQVQRLEDLVHANIIAYNQGCRPSVEGIVAAFVMSLLPSNTSPAPNPSPDLDAFRMIGLAYGQVREIGQTVFIGRLLRNLQSGIPLCHVEQQLSDARWFMSVINRSAWFTLSRAPGAAPPTLIDDNQIELLAFLKDSGLDCDGDRHLKLEHQCLHILFRHVRNWQSIQMDILVNHSDLIRSNEITRAVCDELQALKQSFLFQNGDMISSLYMSSHITYYKWWSTARNVWAVYHLPLPSIVDAITETWMEAMIMAASVSKELIFCCLTEEWRLDLMPKAIGSAVVLCHALLATACLYYSVTYPDWPLPESIDNEGLLREIEQLLESSGHELSSALARTREKLADRRAQMDHQVLAASEPSDPNLFASGDDNFMLSLGLFGDPDTGSIDYTSFLASLGSIPG